MNPDLNIESKVIENFIVKSKRVRSLQFIKKEQTRKKFTDELAHFSDQLELFEEIKTNAWAVIDERLKRLGLTGECYVISENKELDGKRMETEKALTQAIGMGMGTLIVFGNAELVFYEGEGPSDRWIKELNK